MNGTSLVAAPAALLLGEEDLAAVQRSTQDGLVVVATLSWAMMALFHNWRCSLHRANVTMPVLVYAQDLKTKRHVERLGYAAVLSGSARAAAQRRLARRQDEEGKDEALALRAFGTPVYLQLVADRLRFLLALVGRGLDVLTVDVDSVWRADPRVYLDRRGSDLAAPQELAEADLLAAAPPPAPAPPVRGRELCACFLLLTPATRPLLAEALRLVEEEPRFAGNEQKALSFLLLPGPAAGTPWEGLSVQWLPKPQFPSGREYFGLVFHRERGYNKEQRDKVVVVHNNWVKSGEKKRRFKRHGLWLLHRHCNLPQQPEPDAEAGDL